MATQQTTQATGGISVLGALGVLFVGLKLANIIDWSWWYVLLPFYAPLALVVAFGLVVGVGYLFIKLIEYLTGK